MKKIPNVFPKVVTIVVAINNHVAIIYVQIRKNNVEDVLIDGGFGVNIITEQLKLRLGLPKSKLTPYNLGMVDYTTTKPMGLIHDMNTYVHDIPYVIIFIVLQNNVVNVNYSMMLKRPWLKDVKVAHDCENNIVTIQEDWNGHNNGGD